MTVSASAFSLEQVSQGYRESAYGGIAGLREDVCDRIAQFAGQPIEAVHAAQRRAEYQSHEWCGCQVLVQIADHLRFGVVSPDAFNRIANGGVDLVTLTSDGKTKPTPDNLAGVRAAMAALLVFHSA